MFAMAGSGAEMAVSVHSPVYAIRRARRGFRRAITDPESVANKALTRTDHEMETAAALGKRPLDRQ
jgi:hypothetical protein